MKESTGELSMVVVTILAIILIAAVVRFLVPLAQKYVSDQWEELAQCIVTDSVESLID